MKASVADQNALIELQRHDSTIQSIEFKLKNLPELAQLDAIASRINSGLKGITAAELELGDVGVELKRSEIEVEQVTDRINKDEARMNSGQASAKELEQMQHELGTLARRKSELEDGELEIMIRFDAAKAKLETLKSDDAGLRQLEAELKARCESAVAALNTELSVEIGKRKEQATKVEAPLLELYEKIRSSAGGVGAALLVGNTCDGCHLSITPIELEKIKALPSDEVVRCEECRRILVRI